MMVHRRFYAVLFWLGFVLAALVLVLFQGCTPSRPPRPPQPSPAPTPPTSTLPVLRIEGNRFVPAVWGAAAGSGSVPFGWPFASIAYLDAIKINGLNYSHGRGGMYIEDGPGMIAFAQGPDGRYDLTKFNPNFDAAHRAYLQAALDRGIYVEDVMLDDWPHKVGKTPFNGVYNSNGVNYYVGEESDRYSIYGIAAPPPEMEAYVRHRVANACHFPNWFPVLDNEPRAVRTSANWTRALYYIVKNEMTKQVCADRPIGSGNTDAWDIVDYQVIHTFRVPAPSLKPVLVNETDNRDTSPDQYILRAYRGREVGGVYFQYWPGPMEEHSSQVMATLALYGQFVKNPGYPDYGCPEFKGIVVKERYEGGKTKADASPKPFSEGADPLSSLGSGLCEDVWINSLVPLRYQDGYGPDWTIKGGGTVEPNFANPYLAFVYDQVPGSTVVKACSRANTTCGALPF